MNDSESLLKWLEDNNAFTDETHKLLTSGITRKIKNKPEILQRFQEVTRLQTDDPAELIYNIVNPGCSKVCEVCGASTTFDRYYNGYRKTCSRKCASALTAIGGKQTKLTRYGNANYNNKERSQQTKLEKYGDAFFTNTAKGRETKEKRYGNANYNNLEKARATCLERYGCERASQAPAVKEKQRRTILERRDASSSIRSSQHEKAQNNVAERLTTKSHFGDRSELVILINRDVVDGNTL